LVVKKGWKILERSFSGMPGPVSMTWMRTESVAFGAGLDGERAALAEHGLSGVDHEVEEDLFELDEIALDAEFGGGCGRGVRCRLFAGRGP